MAGVPAKTMNTNGSPNGPQLPIPSTPGQLLNANVLGVCVRFANLYTTSMETLVDALAAGSAPPIPDNIRGAYISPEPKTGITGIPINWWIDNTGAGSGTGVPWLFIPAGAEPYLLDTPEKVYRLRAGSFAGSTWLNIIYLY